MWNYVEHFDKLVQIIKLMVSIKFERIPVLFPDINCENQTFDVFQESWQFIVIFTFVVWYDRYSIQWLIGVWVSGIIH